MCRVLSGTGPAQHEPSAPTWMSTSSPATAPAIGTRRIYRPLQRAPPAPIPPATTARPEGPDHRPAQPASPAAGGARRRDQRSLPGGVADLMNTRSDGTRLALERYRPRSLQVRCYPRRAARRCDGSPSLPTIAGGGGCGSADGLPPGGPWALRTATAPPALPAPRRFRWIRVQAHIQRDRAAPVADARRCPPPLAASPGAQSSAASCGAVAMTEVLWPCWVRSSRIILLVSVRRQRCSPRSSSA